MAFRLLVLLANGVIGIRKEFVPMLCFRILSLAILWAQLAEPKFYRRYNT